MKYTSHFSTKETPQAEIIPGKNQVKNNAEGYVFKISNKERLNRFLILGTEGGTYYASEKKLTVENAQSVVDLIKEEGQYVVATVVDVSEKGRAPKNDAAIFTLALCCSFGDADTRQDAYKAIKIVCRTGTHIFQFCEAIQNLRGWSRGLRNAVGSYYTSKADDNLALDVVKYRQRNGWTHKDVLRLSHPKAKTTYQNKTFRYVVGKDVELTDLSTLVHVFENIKDLKQPTKAAVNAIREYNIPREALPTEFLKSKDVWEALLPHMPLTALVRNLGKMSSLEMFKTNLNSNTSTVVNKLTDKEYVKRSRLHPLTILQAKATYASGHGEKGKLSWSSNKNILDALDDAFYLAFDNVEATGKNILLGVDCSGSMGSSIGTSSLTVREAAAALSLVTARTEKNVEIMGFTSGKDMASIGISAKSSLEEVIKKMEEFPWGNTDCSLPILYAFVHKLHVDTFVIYTDNETWAGHIHPTQALENYRKVFNPNAKLIVVGMTATESSIADPNDKGMLDVVGFDTALPKLIENFIKE